MAILCASLTFLAMCSVATSRFLQQDIISTPLIQINNHKLDIAQSGDEKQTVQSKRYYYAVPAANVLPESLAERSSFQQPQQLQIKRPHFINLGRNNSDQSLDNPPKGFSKTAYIPLVIETQHSQLDEDGPVWDTMPPRTSSTTVGPTRPTRKTGQQVTHPSLVHKVSLPVPDTAAKSATVPLGSFRRASRLPEKLPEPQIPNVSTEAPVIPSRCVWAIISCCSANSEHISYKCFEQLGCTGPFWGTSPCDSEISSYAISSANNYYDK